MNTVKIIKAGLIFLIVVLFIITSKLNKTIGKLESEKAKNASLIDNYQEREEDRQLLATKEETIVLTEKEQSEIFTKAVELGNKVCEYQNMTFTLDPSVDQEAWDTNVKNLKSCFNLADNGSAGVAWYPKNAKLTGKWSFVTNPADGGRNVLWLCRNEETGLLLSYAMADYNQETGLFDKLTFVTTFAGNAALLTTPETTTEDPIVSDVQQKVDEITATETQYDENGEPVTTEETTQSSEEAAQESQNKAAALDYREKMEQEQQQEAGE